MSIPIKIKRKADGSIDDITFCPTVTIEKQVWESTLHRSMVLQAENDKLKKWCEELNAFALKAANENAQLKELLKECGNSLEEQSNVRKLYESDVEYRDRYNKKMDLLIKLDEVLK